MNDIVEYLRDFNYVTVAVRLLLAFVLGGIIGTDRERKGRPAGMRTHILVCMGAAITTMTGFLSWMRLIIPPTRCAYPLR